MAAPSQGDAGTLLGIFAKHWEPGCVKTRLAAKIGESHAATLHALFVATMLDRFRNTADRRVVAFSPPESQGAFRGIAHDDWQLMPQSDGDLGQRLQQFFEWGLGQAGRVVVLGSDSPNLPAEHVQAAFEALEKQDVVLGPAEDGGYYLIGLARNVPPIFTGIEWGTSTVWNQTTKALSRANVAWHELPPWYDVDEEPGLNKLLLDLTAQSQSDPQLAKLEREIFNLLSRLRFRARSSTTT